MSDEEQPEDEVAQNLSRRQRRAQAKTGASDSGEVKDRNQRLRAEAASKRRKLRETERASAANEGLDASEKVDDAFVRTADVSARFLRNNFVWLQWVVVLGIAGGMGILIYNYQKSVKGEEQGARLASILGDQFGRITSTDEQPASDARLVDPRSEFASEAERAEKAAKSWERLKSAQAPTLKLAAQLGRAGALYDLRKYGEARAAYEAVLSDPQAGLHPQMKGRAWEGIGFTWEAERKYPEALKAFEKLSALEGDEFKNLHQFHVARVAFLTGDKERALKILTELDAKLSEGAPPGGPSDYVGAATRDLLKTVDPRKAAEEQAAVSAEQMKQLMKQFEQMQKGQGSAAPGVPGLPPPPAPASIETTSPSDAATQAPKTAAPLPQTAPPAPAPVVPAKAPVPVAPLAPRPTAPAAPVAPAPVVPTGTAPPAPAAPAPVTP